MGIQAFSSPASDLRIQTINNSYTLNYLNDSIEYFQTITISDNGIIGGFLGMANWLSLSNVSGELAKATIKIYRNDKVISETTADLGAMYVVNGLTCGILSYETLGFLSGTEVKRGENFKIGLMISGWGSGATPHTSVIIDVLMNLTYKPQKSEFFVPDIEFF